MASSLPRLPIRRQTLLIEHTADGEVIAQRPMDGYIHATALCKKAGKLFADYNRLSSTQAFLKALSTDMEIPTSVLIQSFKGGVEPKQQGTWVHPKVAINLAQWLSPQFAVQASTWVFDWTEKARVSGYMPTHVKRYMANRAKVPPTHFSMLNEVYLHLIAPLEEDGFILPDNMVPDASTGGMFSGFLRKKGIEPGNFPKYEHEFLDNKRPTVEARLYPNEYLADFRAYFHEVWLPKRSLVYFKERAPEAVPLLKQIIAALPRPKN